MLTCCSQRSLFIFHFLLLLLYRLHVIDELKDCHSLARVALTCAVHAQLGFVNSGWRSTVCAQAAAFQSMAIPNEVCLA